jgi:predicted DsbA family dithiol-disulfide isomerase
MEKPVNLIYVTDVLCVWAYIAQIRLDELKQKYGDKVEVEQRFISVFGDTVNRIGKGWQDRGGYEGFSDHVIEVSQNYPHIKINPEVWRSCRPQTSMTSHLFIKAVQLLVDRNEISAEVNPHTGQSIAEDIIWRTRCAFFRDALNIDNLSVLMGLAEEMNLPVAKLEESISDGSAIAALAADIELKENYRLEGSPSFILNEGRQKLFGNVGYRIIEANVVELMENQDNQASWC